VELQEARDTKRRRMESNFFTGGLGKGIYWGKLLFTGRADSPLDFGFN